MMSRLRSELLEIESDSNPESAPVLVDRISTTYVEHPESDSESTPRQAEIS